MEKAKSSLIFRYVCAFIVSTELEIIKRRLLIDGDIAGDEKKLSKLAESYLQFFAIIDEVDNDDDLGERMLVQSVIT